MVKSNFWHRDVRIISAALWNWLPCTSTETSKCYLRSNLNHWCGDAGAGYVSLMWKDKLSQHWQCTEQLWTILKLLQCRTEMEVCFHVLVLAPFQPGDKDIWAPCEHVPPEQNQEGLMGISWDPGKWKHPVPQAFEGIKEYGMVTPGSFSLMHCDGGRMCCCYSPESSFNLPWFFHYLELR